MNAFVRPAKHTFVAIDEIDLSHTIRPYNAAVVAELAQSIRAIGLQTPLTCIVRDDQHVLVSGRNRLEALRVIGASKRLSVSSISMMWMHSSGSSVRICTAPS